MCIQNFASLPSEVPVLPQAEFEKTCFSSTRQCLVLSNLANLWVKHFLDFLVPFWDGSQGAQIVLSGECCSSHLGRGCPSSPFRGYHIYCSSGTHTELFLLPCSRGALFSWWPSWFCPPLCCVQLLLYATSCLFSHPVLVAIFSLFVLVSSFIGLYYNIFFASFFTFYKSKGYCQQWSIKKHSSRHFSGVYGSRRLHLVCWNSILILNIGVNEVFA